VDGAPVVGHPVGLTEGCLVGEVEGKEVSGEYEGAPVGKVLGIPVNGDLVGSPLGPGLGEDV